MKITRARPEDTKTERFIIISMIISDDVCRAIYKIYKPEYFQTKMTREVAKWSMDFYAQYDTAPKQDIQSIFEMKSKSSTLSPDLIDEIEVFLSSISDEYTDWESFNSQYYAELAKSYFKKRSFIMLSNSIREAAEYDDVTEAERRYANFTKIYEQQDTARDITTEKGIQAYKQSREMASPYLFTLFGALGKMVGSIERESLIGILGREKVGKTYHLQIFAEAAAKQGLKVAFIQCGDLSHDQLDDRFACSRTGKALRESEIGARFLPCLDCLFNQKGRCKETESESIVFSDEKGKDVFSVNIQDPDVLRGHTPCIECYKDRTKRSKFQGSVWWKEKNINTWTWGELQKATKHFKKWFKGEIVTEAYPMRSVKMSDVRDWIMMKQNYYNWVPDVCIVDYPDIMLPEDDRQEKRHAEDIKWQIGRRISEEFHNCVIFATQADSKSYGRDTLKLDNYSEAKTKYAHATHFFAINKTEMEERMQVSRLSALLLRDDEAKISQQVTILSHLNYWRPYVSSFFGRVPIMS